MKMNARAALLLLLVAAPASAQSLKLPTAVFAGAAASDWATTYHNVSRLHMVEDNRLIRNITPPALMVAAGAGIDAAAVFTWNRYMGRSHPRIARAGLYVGAAARIYLAGRNISRGRNAFYAGRPAGF